MSFICSQCRKNILQNSTLIHDLNNNNKKTPKPLINHIGNDLQFDKVSAKE